MRTLTFVLPLFAMALSDGQLVALFREAMGIARCTDEQAYRDMGISQSQFSKQMTGVEPPRFLSRIWKIENKAVAQWFFFLGVLRIGPPKEVTRGTPIVLALMARKRMARASLQTARFIQHRKESA